MILVSEKASMDGSSVADCKKNDGLGRIRTGDLRRVKTEVLGLSAAFSLHEITTRNASAPSWTVWKIRVDKPTSFENVWGNRIVG